MPSKQQLERELNSISMLKPGMRTNQQTQSEYEQSIRDYERRMERKKEIERMLEKKEYTEQDEDGDPENVDGGRRRRKSRKHRKVSKKTMKKTSRKHRK